MDEEDNVPVRPGVPVSRRLSIRPRRSFSDSFLSGKQPDRSRETKVPSETGVADSQSVYEPATD